MSMDLDAMRGRWQESNQRAEAAIAFDAGAMRAALAARTRRAFRWHSLWLLGGIAVGALATALLLAFALRHLGDWRYAAMSAGLLALVVAELVVDLRQFLGLRALAPDAPLLAVRDRLDALRARRAAMAKWIALTALLLWWPALLVLFKALTGVDALRFVPASVVWVNLAIGLAAIPVGLALSAWLSRRYGASAAWRRLQVEAGGASWKQAEEAFAAREDFEAKLAEGRLAADAAPVALPPELAAPVRALRRRIGSGIAVYAVLIVATGVFNAMHGGQAGAIVAGVLVNLLWVSQLVGSILHWRAAMAPLPGVSLSAWRDALLGVVAGRERALLSAALADLLAVGALRASRKLAQAIAAP
jgi:hypothetical protein